MRSTRWPGSVVVALLLVSASTAARVQQPALDPNASVAVVVTYADGFRATMTVGPRSGGAWTARFPRVTSWTPPAGQELVGAIKYACERTPDGVRVVISVFRGAQRQQDEPIATVGVTPVHSVVVDAELRAVGVQPVTLSVSPIATLELLAPSVSVVSPQIEIAGTTVVKAPIPTYIVTLRNGSTKLVRSIEVHAMRAGQLALSGLRSGRDGDALIAPGDTYELTLQVPARSTSAGAVTLAPIDHIEVTTVRWADGTYDGNAADAAYDAVFDYGTRMQLALIVAELDRAKSAGPMAAPSTLREALRGLPVEATDEMIDGSQSRAGAMTRPATEHAVTLALQQARKAALDDLASFESGRAAPGAFEGWLNTEHDRYQRWMDRLGGAGREAAIAIWPSVAGNSEVLTLKFEV